MSRPATVTEIICDRFKALLTEGFYVTSPDGEVFEDQEPERLDALRDTKSWRNDLWQMFREIEDSMCPVRAFEREAARRTR